MRISDWSSDVCSSDLARIADAECASLNVRVFRIEARQVCSHRHTSQAPVRLDADLIVTDIFRPVSWLRGARFLRSRHAGIEATRIVATARRRIKQHLAVQPLIQRAIVGYGIVAVVAVPDAKIGSASCRERGGQYV